MEFLLKKVHTCNLHTRDSTSFSLAFSSAHCCCTYRNTVLLWQEVHNLHPLSSYIWPQNLLTNPTEIFCTCLKRLSYVHWTALKRLLLVSRTILFSPVPLRSRYKITWIHWFGCVWTTVVVVGYPEGIPHFSGSPYCLTVLVLEVVVWMAIPTSTYPFSSFVVRSVDLGVK